MAQQTLTFAAEGGKYKAAWTSAGAAVVQLQRSAPGGVDREAAQALGLTVVPALSLPGKTAPVSAGAAIRNTLYNILREAGC